jgi:hypothetical protein
MGKTLDKTQKETHMPGKEHWPAKYKPAASAKTHLLLAAAAWSLVGSVLIAVAIYWAHAGDQFASYMVLPILLGLVKSHYVLDKAARRAIARIIERGDGKCIGGFFSYKSWLLVGVMAGAGRLLRSGIISKLIVAFIYAAVGSALLYSSRLFWKSYMERKKLDYR